MIFNGIKLQFEVFGNLYDSIVDGSTYLMIQLLAVEMEEPRWRRRRGRISEGYTQTVAWKPMVKAPWKMKSMVAAPIPAMCAMEVLCCTWKMSAAWTAMTAAMTLIIERRSGRRPMRSIRNQGINDAMKNHVCRKPDIRADVCWSNPMLFSKRVPE